MDGMQDGTLLTDAAALRSNSTANRRTAAIAKEKSTMFRIRIIAR